MGCHEIASYDHDSSFSMKDKRRTYEHPLFEEGRGFAKRPGAREASCLVILSSCPLFDLVLGTY